MQKPPRAVAVVGDQVTKARVLLASGIVKPYGPRKLVRLALTLKEWGVGPAGGFASLAVRAPDDVGLVVHDWTERMTGFAGINHRRPHVAAAAVDLVATQLMHHEHGVPEVPRQILIPPAWIEGPSVRPRA